MFLFLYVGNVDCCARGAFGFLIGHSVLSIMTLVVGNFDLKSDGLKYLTRFLDGHILISRHCLAINIIHVKIIFSHCF